MHHSSVPFPAIGHPGEAGLHYLLHRSECEMQNISITGSKGNENKA